MIKNIMIVMNMTVKKMMSRSSSSLNVKEEEDFLLSGKARLRVKSLVSFMIMMIMMMMLYIYEDYDDDCDISA